MELALRDQQIYRMQCELKNRKKMLCTKGKQLHKYVNENNYLKDIVDDYNKYNTYIMEEKKKKMNALHDINDYITKINAGLHMTDNALDQSKKEQRRLLHEIDNIKNDLDEIINSNDSINE